MTKEQLKEQILELKTSEIANTISQRIKDFEQTGKEKQDKIFSELCFCLLTANFQAEKCIQIQKDVGRGFEIFPEDKLAQELKKQGHRFWPKRANRIVEARECKTELCNIMNPEAQEMRDWLVRNIKGLGMKEASHFLRNIGYKDLAIIDFHISDILEEHKIIQKPKTLTKKKYLEIENILRQLGNQLNLSLAELDIYLWYLETGKVLK
jgi:N-glycosylase/DNA lyase